MDWDEIAKLAADLQQIQLTTNLEKLSERNCIEIMTKLIENNNLQIIFTNDGKEYVTIPHLAKEAEYEVDAHGGRVSLDELAQILNVDLNQVVAAANDIAHHNQDYKVIMGCLLNKDYMNNIIEDMGHKLIQYCYINVAELTLHYNLPVEFIRSLVEEGILKKIIHAEQDVQDRRIFYTKHFINTNKAKVRGALFAITKPVPLSVILTQCSISESIIFSILDSLQKEEEIPGIIKGTQVGNCFYVPNIYSRSQTEWISNCFKQNGYLEYDTLSRLAIHNPKKVIKQYFPNDDVILLNTVAVSTAIVDQVDAIIEEVVATKSFIDICPLLPSVLTEEDIQMLLQKVIKNEKVNIFAESIVVSREFLSSLHTSLKTIVERKAKSIVASGKWMQLVCESKNESGNILTETKVQKKEDRRKKSQVNKSGGKSQARETKTKSTKKKYLQNKMQNDSEEQCTTRVDESIKFELVSVEDIKNEIIKDDKITAVDNLVDDLALFLQPSLDKYAFSIANQLAQNDSILVLNEFEERLNFLVTNIKVFYEGIKHFDNNSQNPLIKYLLKSLGTDLVTTLFRLIAQQNKLQCPENLNNDGKYKILLQLPPDIKETFQNLNAALTKDSVEDFLNCAIAAMQTCSLGLKKRDKKKERQLVLDHKEALLKELNTTEDPELGLHLIINLLFTEITHCALHISGRHISLVLSFIQPFLTSDFEVQLLNYYELVKYFLITPNESIKTETQEALKIELEKVKNIANNIKSCLKKE